MGNNLRQVFKKFAFQKEPYQNGGHHWQIRGHLWKAKTPASAVQEFGELTFNGHWSITSNEVHLNNNFNYCMKGERIDGPWTDKDGEFDEPPPLTLQLIDFMNKELYPWQKHITEEVKKIDFRKIKLIIDNIGDTGKSVFAEWLEYEGLAYEIPPMTCMEDIMQCCMGIKPQKCYLIDMPRGMKKDKLAGFYSGIEALKNGVMYDKRYKFDKRRISRPQIIIFTNTWPDISLMSLDRWCIWEMQEDKSLKLIPIV